MQAIAKLLQNPPTAPPPPPTSNWTDYRTKTVKELNLPDACPTCGGAGYLRRDLPVDHPHFGEPIPCACHLQKQNQTRQQHSQLKGWLSRAAFDNYRANGHNRAALQAAQKFAQNPHAWLTLWGNYGTGKTHLLAAAVNHCLVHNISAAYYTLPDLLDQLRAGYDLDDYFPLFKHLCTVQVLALDEVDKVNCTSWVEEKFYQLADDRYRHRDQLGTLFALNHNPDVSLAETNGSPLGHFFSRMYDEHSQVIHLLGPDARPVAKTLWISHSDPEAD